MFMDRFPTVQSLSEADESEVRQFITPLGMEYTRTRLLQKLCKVIILQFNGKVPRNREDLLNLPGVGPYIANAVLSFAYGRDLALIDTNVLRVIHRVFSVNSQKTRPRTDPALWNFVQDIMPESKGREFNLAILDFASTVCTLRSPKCIICPMKDFCDYNVGVGIWADGKSPKINIG